MEYKKSIEEQVAELTQEQQDKLYKVGRIATVAEWVGNIIAVIAIVFCYFKEKAMLYIVNARGYIYHQEREELNMWFALSMVVLIVLCVYVGAIFISIKISCPYYSEKKWKYICKMRKRYKK